MSLASVLMGLLDGWLVVSLDGWIDVGGVGCCKGNKKKRKEGKLFAIP